jgi:hypothetical protein
MFFEIFAIANAFHETSYTVKVNKMSKPDLNNSIRLTQYSHGGG